MQTISWVVHHPVDAEGLDSSREPPLNLGRGGGHVERGVILADALPKGPTAGIRRRKQAPQRLRWLLQGGQVHGTRHTAHAISGSIKNAVLCLFQTGNPPPIPVRGHILRKRQMQEGEGKEVPSVSFIRATSPPPFKLGGVCSGNVRRGKGRGRRLCETLFQFKRYMGSAGNRSAWQYPQTTLISPTLCSVTSNSSPKPLRNSPKNSRSCRWRRACSCSL